MNDWHYEPAEDLDKTLVERLRRFPREPDMFVYGMRTSAALLMRSWLKLYNGLEVAGRENLPTDQSYVLVANHSSHLDVLCLLSALPLGNLHRVFPAAAQDYFFVSVPRMVLATVVVNALPFARQANSLQSISVCQNLLQNRGNVLIVFPEGTRSPHGNMAAFKPGIGLLLAGTEIPVVPCYLDGAHKGWPKGAWLPRPSRVRLTIGKPRLYSHLSIGKESAMQISRELHDAVRGLQDDSQAAPASK